MGAGAQLVGDLRPGDQAAHRHAAGERLGEGDDVGRDAPVLVRVPIAGAPHARLHLVGDEEDAVLVGELVEGGQEAVRWHDVSTLAKDRLDQERGHVVGVDDGGEELLDTGEAVGHGGIVVSPGRVAQDVRIGSEVHAAEERLEVAAVLDAGAGERHGAVGAAVEAAPEGDDPRPPRRVLRQLDGRLDRLRAGVRQEETRGLPVAQAREGARQALVELEARLVVEDVLLGVDDPRGLLCDRCGNARMGMAGVRDADPAGVVQVSLTVDRLDPRAAAALDHEVGVARPHRRDAIPTREPGGRVVRALGLGHRLATGIGAPAPASSPSRPPRRWAQIWTAMKMKAMRKKIVPRAFTSGGMPILLAP